MEHVNRKGSDLSATTFLLQFVGSDLSATTTGKVFRSNVIRVTRTRSERIPSYAPDFCYHLCAADFRQKPQGRLLMLPVRIFPLVAMVDNLF